MFAKKNMANTPSVTNDTKYDAGWVGINTKQA